MSDELFVDYTIDLDKVYEYRLHFAYSQLSNSKDILSCEPFWFKNIRWGIRLDNNNERCTPVPEYIKRAFFITIWMLDVDRYKMPYYEQIDWCIRIRLSSDNNDNPWFEKQVLSQTGPEQLCLLNDHQTRIAMNNANYCKKMKLQISANSFGRTLTSRSTRPNCSGNASMPPSAMLNSIGRTLPLITPSEKSNANSIDEAIAKPIAKPITKSVSNLNATADISIDLKSQKIGPLTDAVFKDLKITCHNEYVLDCNKFVVARESKVILKTLTNLSSKEARNGTFDIGHKCATTELTRIFIDCMYEGWSNDQMDENANEILQLAHFYECKRIIEMAIHSLIRHLTDETFWDTMALAGHIKKTSTALIDECAKFASTTATRVYELLNRDDHGSDGTVAKLMKAIAMRHKK